jgi:negative regulator of sigma E activity
MARRKPARAPRLPPWAARLVPWGGVLAVLIAAVSITSQARGCSQRVDRIESGAALAFELLPKVEETVKLAGKVDSTEKRVKATEEAIREIGDAAKQQAAAEAERRKFQQALCAAGELEREVCIALGYPTPPRPDVAAPPPK